ncbi:hypothetical protein [Comamonas endophytica]|uniref:Uncharacterized protein n=1 Tax=Comamonas endophytica TaxID=2949090 RepID=A0ABY6GBX4_9BURK|nr:MULTISPECIES: hypothetical protein [unclassified Acidovorax]MCD2513562.1 hypothetical protein [Acidovorax sp. D4N7]UYG52428.1 hypothetical protein M9799_04070 [Acidovorax sp. 5MLIR]
MATLAITTSHYKLFPSPRNLHRVVFEYEVFVPHPYALIDLPSFELKGKHSLFAACRLKDGKMGQLVTFELVDDAIHFEKNFTPD